MPSNTISRGNLMYDTALGLTITPPANIVATALTAGTYTVPGLNLLDMVTIFPISGITTYSITSAYVSAPGTLTIYFSSETGATVSNAAAIQVMVDVQRYENEPMGFASLPPNFA